MPDESVPISICSPFGRRMGWNCAVITKYKLSVMYGRMLCSHGTAKKHQQKQHVQSTRCVTHSRLSSVSCLARNRWKSGRTFWSAVRSVHPSTFFFFYEMKNWQSGSSLSSDKSVWNSWAEATVTSGYKPITSCLTLLRDVCLHSGQLKGVLVRISRERFFSYCPVRV